MFEVRVSGSFAAAHRLRGTGGALEPLHEHEWRVTVTCAGEQLDELGLLLDFNRLRMRLSEVLVPLNQLTLNDLPAFAHRNPSAENVAAYVAEQLAAGVPGPAYVSCVEVEEEPGCCARFRPPRPTPASPV
ncbi:MAG: 6-carboxytetrahydropterin synthase [Planctomycetes bacterium]|nr:6-carboxytetrahydropterin synthase [Planctomycetota bacterium]